MPRCTDASIELGRLGWRVIEANFEGGDIGGSEGDLAAHVHFMCNALAQAGMP